MILSITLISYSDTLLLTKLWVRLPNKVMLIIKLFPMVGIMYIPIGLRRFMGWYMIVY